MSEKKNNNMWMTHGRSIFFFKPTTRLVRNNTARWESPQLLQKTASINVGPSLHHLLKNKQLAEHTTHRRGHLTEDVAPKPTDTCVQSLAPSPKQMNNMWMTCGSSNLFFDRRS